MRRRMAESRFERLRRALSPSHSGRTGPVDKEYIRDDELSMTSMAAIVRL